MKTERLAAIEDALENIFYPYPTEVVFSESSGLLKAKSGNKEYQINSTPDDDAEEIFNQETDFYFVADDTEYVAIMQ